MIKVNNGMVNVRRRKCSMKERLYGSSNMKVKGK